MAGTQFDLAVRAITAALGTRSTSGITSFPQLFTDDGVIEVPFDGDGGTPPMRGRDAFTAMVSRSTGCCASRRSLSRTSMTSTRRPSSASARPF